MTTTARAPRRRLPQRFDALVRMMPPQAIRDDVQHDNTLETIDRLMAIQRLSPGQALYLETLIQLVRVYESERHGIDVSDIRGLDSLRHLLAENGMNASDLARLLGIHPSMGSKILNGQRSLTIQHLRRLCDRFKVGPGLFID